MSTPIVWPAVWLDCLSCYTEGRLVGAWFPNGGVYVFGGC